VVKFCNNCACAYENCSSASTWSSLWFSECPRH
jgi:hypothetical protein